MTQTILCRLIFICAMLVSLPSGYAVEQKNPTGTIQEVITSKVVTVKMPSGQTSPGDKLEVVVDGKVVGVLEVRNLNGLCRVVSGNATQGATVRKLLIKDSAFEQKDIGTVDKAVKDVDLTMYSGDDVTDPVERGLLRSAGKIQLAVHAAQFLPVNAAAAMGKDLEAMTETLDRIHMAQMLLQLPSRESRVAASLRDAGNQDLARRVSSSTTPDFEVHPPILPAAASKFMVQPFGEASLIVDSPTRWATPQFWGKPPIAPIFAGWSMENGRARIGGDAEALVRNDIMLDDMEVIGNVKLETKGLSYLIVRSGIVVKFHCEQGQAGVSVKIGFDNLSRSTYQGSCSVLNAGQSYSFQVQLIGEELKAFLDDEEVLACSIDQTSQSGAKLPARGHVGLGTRYTAGEFSDVVVKALSPSGKRALPIFEHRESYEADGKPIDLLSASDKFISLYGPKENAHRRVHHNVTDELLTISGSPYSQFAVKGTDADHFKVTGEVRLLEEGTAWLRVNQALLIGMSGVSKDRELEDGEHSFFVKNSPGNFHVYEEGFPGSPLFLREWYPWELEYHHPVAKFYMNGQLVLVTQTPANTKSKAKNQFGLSSYNAKTEFMDLQLQKFSPKGNAILDESVVRTLYSEAKAEVEKVGRLLQAKSPIAAGVLDGTHPLDLADSADYIAIAEEIRNRNDWPTYLDLLRANFDRLPEESPDRRGAETAWQNARQKFELAQELLEPGEIGLDNIIRAGDEAPIIEVEGDSAACMIYDQNRDMLSIFSPAQRRSLREFAPPVKFVQMLDRGKQILLLTEDRRQLVIMDKKLGQAVHSFILSGPLMDWAAFPKTSGTYLSINLNEPGELVFSKCQIQILDETSGELTPTQGFGMFLATDPHGRFLYSGIHVPFTPRTGTFDPSPIRPQVNQGSIDHLMCFRVVSDDLELIGDRPQPGLGGNAIAADPTGKMVCYIAKDGFYQDKRKELTGQRVAAFRAGHIDSTLNSFNTGGAPTLSTFSPVSSIFWVYTGKEVKAFDAGSFALLKRVTLPPRIPPGAVTAMEITGDGKKLIMAFKGKPGGVYVCPIPQMAGTLTEPPAETLQQAKNLAKEGETGKAVSKLSELADALRFTPLGEQAAGELLKLEGFQLDDVSLKVDPLETVDLDTEKSSLPQGTPEVPVDSQVASKSAHADDDEYKMLVDDLDSFRTLAKDYPNCWFQLWSAVDRNYKDDCALQVMAIQVSTELGYTNRAISMCRNLLNLCDGSGSYAVQAYRILSKIAGEQETPAAQIYALKAALKVNPRNPFLHRALGEVYEACVFTEHSSHHYQESLRLFPSQADLRVKLALPQVDETEKSIAQLYEEIAGSVALVRKQGGVGSGFFISQDGLILTNQHVIGSDSDNSKLTVEVLESGSEKAHTFPARVVASDPRLDIAILSINPGNLKIRPLLLAGGEQVKPGMRTIAIGNPGMGTQVLTRTVTEGIVSNAAQKLLGQAYIQTSAAVNPGNSGGPLLDLQGRVIGMVTLKARLDNVGFAIPVERLHNYLQGNLN